MAAELPVVINSYYNDKCIRTTQFEIEEKKKEISIFPYDIAFVAVHFRILVF